jgi:hypothetical protein
MRLMWLSLAAFLALASCAGAQQKPAPRPASAPVAPSAPDDACVRQARALGFIVRGAERAYRDAYGTTVVPLLVVWGNSAIHIDCHIDRQGGITVE